MPRITQSKIIEKIKLAFTTHSSPDVRFFNQNCIKKIYLVNGQFFYNETKPWLVCQTCLERDNPNYSSSNEARYQRVAHIYGELPNRAFKMIIFFDGIYPFHKKGYVYCKKCYLKLIT